MAVGAGLGLLVVAWKIVRSPVGLILGGAFVVHAAKRLVLPAAESASDSSATDDVAVEGLREAYPRGSEWAPVTA
jgi:hypothetical protein